MKCAEIILNRGQQVWTSEPFKDNITRCGYITTFDDDGFYVSFRGIPLSAWFAIEDIGTTIFTSEDKFKASLRNEADNV